MGRRLTLGIGIIVALCIIRPGIAVSKTPSEVYEAVSPSIVIVQVYNAKGKPIRLGSGVVIGVSKVITNCHVVVKGVSFKIQWHGSTYSASLDLSDNDRDLCQLNVPDFKAFPVVISSVTRLKVGSRVYAVGAPRGLELTLSEGIVSSLRLTKGGSLIQTTAPISPGSSGGGLFDEEGRLIGITTFYVKEGQNLNFALPADWIAEIPKRGKLTKKIAFKSKALDWEATAGALQEKKSYQVLLKHSIKWTQAKPNDVVAWLYLGIAYYELKNPYKAIESFRHAIRLEPDNFFGWFTIGIAYQNVSRMDEAIDAYTRAIKISPDSSLAWQLLGITYKNIGSHEKALEAFHQTIKINPDDDSAWINLGSVYEDIGLYEKSVEAYRQALKLNHNSIGHWIYLGDAYSKLGQPEKALQSYEEALRIRPQNAMDWFCHGVIYCRRGNREKTREIYQILIKLDQTVAAKYFDGCVMP